MGDEKETEQTEEKNGDVEESPFAAPAADADPAFPPGTTDQKGAKERMWDAPGHIPEPEEKLWETKDEPFDGIDRSDPFAGRPQTEIPEPEEPSVDDDPFADAPGQPRRK